MSLADKLLASYAARSWGTQNQADNRSQGIMAEILYEEGRNMDAFLDQCQTERAGERRTSARQSVKSSVPVKTLHDEIYLDSAEERLKGYKEKGFDLLAKMEERNIKDLKRGR